MSNSGPQHSDSPSRPTAGDQASDTSLSEAEYLARESAATKAALARTLEDLKKSVRTGADLRMWVRRHPWAALGAAAVAGFSAASVVTAKPASKMDSTAHTNGHADDNGHEKPSSPLAATIFASLFDLAKVALEASIAATAPSADTQSQEPPVPEHSEA
jgi:hypothetical protein